MEVSQKSLETLTGRLKSPLLPLNIEGRPCSPKHLSIYSVYTTEHSETKGQKKFIAFGNFKSAKMHKVHR